MGGRGLVGGIALGLALVGQLTLGLLVNSVDVSAANWVIQVGLAFLMIIGVGGAWWLERAASPQRIFGRELSALVEAAGSPTTPALQKAVKQHLSTPLGRLDEQIESTLKGRTSPSWDLARSIILASTEHAQHIGRHLSSDDVDMVRWQKRHTRLLGSRAGQRRTLAIGTAALILLVATVLGFVETANRSKHPTVPYSSPSASGPRTSRSAYKTPGTQPAGPNLFGLRPSSRIHIDENLKVVHDQDTVVGRSDDLCCNETIWILVQPVGDSTVYPQGYCDLGGGVWTCDARFDMKNYGAGTRFWVTAVVIHSEESPFYEHVRTDGYQSDDPPITPRRVSSTIIVTRI
jgi:hypothetical protein